MHYVQALYGKGIHIEEKLILRINSFLDILFIIVDLGFVLIMEDRILFDGFKSRFIVGLVYFQVPAEVADGCFDFHKWEPAGLGIPGLT